MGGLRSVSVRIFLHKMEVDVQAKRFPMMTFTQIWESVSQLLHFPFSSEKITNPAQEDKGILEKYEPPFLVVCPIVDKDSCRNDKVIECEKGY